MEVFNGRALSSSRNMREIAEDLKLPITGGSDAHCMAEVGGVCIIVGNDPMDSIKRGDVKVEVNTNKMNLLRSYLIAGLRRFIG